MPSASYYLGVDIGGTKIAGALVTGQGRILSRAKVATPKKVRPIDVEQCVVSLMDELLSSAGTPRSHLRGIGVGVPGIVDTVNHRILAAPNISLTGHPLSSRLKTRYKTRVVLSNDVNLGLLGETWMGVAKGMTHVIGVFPGTGVGGAAVINGELLLGIQGAATELGHMIVDVHGPLCHCGNHGCLESLTSRWAIERDIRALVKAGRKTRITKLTDGKLRQIKSRVLKEALERNDVLTKHVLTKVSLILGRASVTLNHIFNPQAIVFGGGVIKACGCFMLPLIANTVKADPFFKKFNSCRILQSKLGDDAVPLGAVKLVSASS